MPILWALCTKRDEQLRIFIALFICTIFFSLEANGADYTYNEIAKRHTDSSLRQEDVNAAKMQGECLVGLKELNFKKKNKFDPVSEWTSYRSVSLLEQYSPCEVLIIMEVAQAKLKLISKSK